MKEQRDMSGLMFKAKPSDNPNRPGYEGSVRIDGKDYWISGWVKDGAKGKFFSLSFKPKKDNDERAPKSARTDGDDMSDIPF